LRRIATIVVVASALALSDGRSTLADRLVAGYEIDWKGLEIGAFEAELTTTTTSYRLSYRARTAGMLGWLFPFESEGWSEGTRADDQPMARHYQASSRWRDGGGDWGVSFAPDGRADRIEVPAEELAERDPVPAQLAVAPDPLTLILEAAGAAGPGVRLSGTSFDGKRALRFELACGDEMVRVALTRTDDGEHAALICSATGELAAGASRRWHDRHADEGEERPPAKVWLGRDILEDGYWPVRVEIDTEYGTVIARLIKLEPASATSANSP